MVRAILGSRYTFPAYLGDHRTTGPAICPVVLVMTGAVVCGVWCDAHIICILTMS